MGAAVKKLLPPSMSSDMNIETYKEWIRRAEINPKYASKGQVERWRAEVARLEMGQGMLSGDHREMLRKSAITEEVIRARGYRTIISAIELQDLGFSATQCRAPGLLLPLWTTDGINALSVYRPDNPRCFDNKNKKKNPDGTWPQRVLKYEYPKGQDMRIDCPPVCRHVLGDPSVPLWITEGQKKADALASAGLCTIALLGVYNWRGKNELGGTTVLADWENIALNGREVRIVFDSDISENENVQCAMLRLAAWLGNKKATVTVAYLPALDGRSKTGVDDWLADGHTVAELEQLLQAPRKIENKSNRILSDEYIAALSDLGYSFRMLELDYTIEVNGELLNDALEAEIKTKLRDQGYDKVNVARDAYVAHAYHNRYHPIKDYLESLMWDGKDHINTLSQYFADEDAVIGKWLRKWLIGAVARVYLNGAQNRTLILSGEQDLGKSYFVRWLASGLGGKYYADAIINPEDKDCHIRLMNIWIWEIGELNATTGKMDRNALKQFLSREQVRERVPYGRNDIVRPAITSFIATVNNNGGFLNDPTGNRRFATCALNSIVWDYAVEVDVNQVWAQAKHLFDAGEKWRYTEEDQILVTEINDRYEIENPIHGWLYQMIEFVDGEFTPTTRILADLRFHGARGSDKALTGDIASYMMQHGIKSGRGYVMMNGQQVQLRGWLGARLRPITEQGQFIMQAVDYP